MSHQVQFDVSDDSSNVDFEGEEGETSLMMNASLEIRSIINDYDDTLRTATQEIKTLTR